MVKTRIFDNLCYCLLTLFTVSLSAPSLLHSQERLKVYFDALTFASEHSDSVRVDMYASVPYNVLMFERTGSYFSANYTCTFKVTDSLQKVYLDTVFTRKLRVSSPEISNGDKPAFDFYQTQVLLTPGKFYTVALTVNDSRSTAVLSYKRSINTVLYKSYPVAVSGLLLVSKIREDSSGYSITPMITDNVTSSNGFFLFMELYNNTPKTKYRLSASYKHPTGKTTSTFWYDKSVPSGKSQQWLRMSTDGIPKGLYDVQVAVYNTTDTTKPLATSQREVRVESSPDGMPMSPEELDERIMELRYVASSNDIENIRDGESFTEKRKRFVEFWTRLDPTPGTVENEAMIEYFRRIDFVNERYRSYAAGWLTDKGHVYVVYGPPDYTSVDPFRNNGKPVETWQYYRRNMRFVFLDETGFGDFRLNTPMPPGEKFKYSGS